MPLLLVAAAAVVSMSLHVATMALTARAFGLSIRRVVFGGGPTLLRIGKLRLKAVLFVGSLQLEYQQGVLAADRFDTGTADGCDAAATDDLLDALQRVLLPLSGPHVALAVAVLLLGPVAVESFSAAFGQIVGGAFAPLSVAQRHLETAAVAVASSSFSVVLALTLTKLAAFNLLPLGGLNGFDAAVALARMWKIDPARQAALFRWLVVPTLAIMVSWGLALVLYAFT